jgi:hypothetical protein
MIENSIAYEKISLQEERDKRNKLGLNALNNGMMQLRFQRI